MERPPHILIIEDETALSTALHDKLTRSHYEVTVVGDGERGLNSALNSHPSLIILDLIMPHMTGMEMLSRLRKDAWGESVPVIILTNVGNMTESSTITRDPYVELLVKSETSLNAVILSIEKLVGLAQ